MKYETIRIWACYKEEAGKKPNASGLRYAATEVKQFLQEYTTVKTCVKMGEKDRESDQAGDVVLCVDTSMEGHCYALKGDGKSLTVLGGTESAVLCGVYEALGAAGICFDITGYSLSGAFDMDAFFGINREVRPKARFRGIRQHINFPMDISSYSLKEAKEYIRAIARMRFNAITFHSYGGQWHSVEPGEPKKQAGHFFYGQYHPIPTEDFLTADRIQNRKTYCIPEAEALFDDLNARGEYAKYWLNEVMKTAKEVQLKITLSVELPFDNEEKLCFMLHEVCKTYPQIDVLELISVECGGSIRINDFTRDTAVDIMVSMFGRQILDSKGNLPGLGEELPSQLEGAAVHLKRMITALDIREKWLAGLSNVPELRAGLYITCQNTLKILWPIMREQLPADVSRSLLPAHGSLAAANTIAAIGTNEYDWQNTMYYGWAEFDGNMYIQQFSTDGIEKLIAMSDAESIYGFCINHWRTAENRITIAYAAQAAITPLTTREFYAAYAKKFGLEADQAVVAVCDRMAVLDTYCRDNLFNIGFCYVNLWFRKGNIARPKQYLSEDMNYAIAEFEGIVDTWEEILTSARTKEGIALVRLMINRCTTSILHIRSLLVLQEINQLYDYDAPTELSKEQMEKIHQIIERSRNYAQEYIHLYGELIPDRGVEGNIVSYCVTIPPFIDAVASNFIRDIQVESTESFDAPPLPDEASK